MINLRLLFYGLQNSGATLLTLLAGQRPGSVVVPDLWTMYCAPETTTGLDFCLKATITHSFPLDEHLAAFRPDHVFLVVRRPVDNVLSLRRKHYARHNGTLEQKLALADDAFLHRERFTDVLVFEDVVTDPATFVGNLRALGWELPPNAVDFPRGALEMERFIWEHAPDLYGSVQWGAGEARVEPLGTVRLSHAEDEEAAAFALANSPGLHHFYEERGPRGARRTTTAQTAQDEVAFQSRANYTRNLLAVVEAGLRGGRTAEALALATEITELVPDNIDAWSARARALERGGSVDLAVQMLENVRQTLPDDAPLRAELELARARQALRLGRVEQASELVAAAIQEDRGLVPALLLSAEIWAQQGDWPAAQRYAESVLSSQPRNVSAGLVLANALVAGDQTAQAVRVLEACIAVQPDFEPGRRRLAELLSEAGPPGSS